MSKIAIIPISEAGRQLAQDMQPVYHATMLDRHEVAEHWHDYDAFIFIGALGICVRTIAPCVEDKHTDPAVVCLDSQGKHAISVLSGHVGGANELTQEIAFLYDCNPVITTQSDNTGLWPLDLLAMQYDWTLLEGSDSPHLNECIATFVNGGRTALLLDIRDEGTEYMERTMPDNVTLIDDVTQAHPYKYDLLIVVSPFEREAPMDIATLHYVPNHVLSVGFGLARDPKGYEQIYEQMRQAISEHGIIPIAANFCSIDIKADETFVYYLQHIEHETTRFFTAQELAQVEVPNPSDTVARHVGTASVCEASAILGANHGELIMPKVKGKDWTVAVAIDRKYLRHGHIEIVGAGPGDPDLVSVRGRQMLERADLILYAGSLVPRELTQCHKAGAVVRSSANMTLEEQCALMKEHYDHGHYIVRLHTGDPCIFGAIQEQMAYFDREGMDYHITPGISSFLAAAAELRSQFTIPERTQTIILTRGEGRTPMPEKEQLHLLARSQSTMCIFLSAAIVDDVQRELLQEYPEDTPVAACYHLTWPDQKIYRGVLRDLAKIVHDNNLTLTTMLVVGEAIDNRQGLSELYNKHFTHLFRQGDR